jgi:NADH dehydrogenase
LVGDIAEAMARLVDAGVASGETYEFGGPEVFAFRDLIDFILRTTGRTRLSLPIPFGIARLMGALVGWMPKPFLTMDQVELLKSDNVVSASATAEARTLQGLGIAPHNIEAIVPSYLYRYRKAGQFTALPE